MEATLEQINGRVIAIRYASRDFAVALLAQQNGEETVIVGDLAAIEEGQDLSLYGRATLHPKHGPQFRVEYFHPVMARSREAICRFLTEQVSGIGTALSERIVSYFYPLHGEAMLERLLEEPEQLREMPGLGETRVQAVIDTLRESYGSRQFLLELYEVGISPTMARTILKFYEEKGIDPLRVFQETPYQIVQDIPTLRFETLDRIVRQRGLPQDDEGRLQAAITHILLRAFHRSGHFYLPEQPLLEHLYSLIWQDAPPPDAVNRIGDALERLRNQRYVQIVAVDEELAFYTRHSWITEEELVWHLSRLLEAPVPPLGFASLSSERVREAAEERAGIILDPAQAAAFDHAMASGVCIVTGGPGTGKSTLARLIVDSWEEAGLTVKLAAPTGRAARRLAELTEREVTTVHRLLEWREGEFQRNEVDPIEAEAILIDESSMLDAPLAWSLCRAIPDGCRVLFMGDVDQLPSVGPGNVLHDLIESGRLPVARLNQIHRQDTSQENLIVQLAHAINNAPPGQPIPGGPTLAKRPADGNVFLFDTRLPWARCSCGGVRLPHHCPTCEDGEGLAMVPVESRAAELIQELVMERIPRTFGVASVDVQVIAPRYGGSMGVDELNERLRGALNPARATRPELIFGDRHFRLGDRVMAIRNNYEKDVVNGLQGEVVDVDPSTKMVKVRFDGEVSASFRKDELDDLTHAYAITVHKSQGGEFPVVVLVLDPSAGPLLHRQLLYTAVTRARDLLVLVGDPIVLERATRNNRPRDRWTGLGWWLRVGFEG
ncbi:MAG: AAA family ATPase [Chloroflexota bacterium]|nr:AAA family ATPase [Chloroflexota bacterium]